MKRSGDEVSLGDGQVLFLGQRHSHQSGPRREKNLNSPVYIETEVSKQLDLLMMPTLFSPSIVSGSSLSESQQS